MLSFFFFNDTATTEIYTLSLHDALPISAGADRAAPADPGQAEAHPVPRCRADRAQRRREPRSEEHTSELQSRQYLVCRLLLEKKKKDILLQVFSIELPARSSSHNNCMTG